MGEAFAPGAEVQLKSGGPVMTVVEFGEYSYRTGYLCRWFDSKQELKESVFTEAELRAIEAPRKGGSSPGANLGRSSPWS